METSQTTNSDKCVGIASTSVTDPITASNDEGEIGAEKTAVDSSNVTEMDTSMQNSAKPKIPPPLPVSQ